MNADPVTTDRVEWKKVFPGLHILSAVRMAFRLRVLVPCWMAVLAGMVLVRTVDLHRNWPDAARLGPESYQWRCPDCGGLVNDAFHWLQLVPHDPVHAADPLTTFLLYAAAGSGAGRSAAQWLLLPSACLVITAVAAMAVGRATSAEFCSATRCGAIAGLKYGLRHLPAALLSLLIAVVIAGLFLLPLVLAGMFGSPDSAVSAFVMTAWLPLTLVAVLAVPAVMICFIAWLLSLCAIGTDGCGGADALSRGICYLLSHKVRTAWYLLLVTAASLIARAVMIFLAHCAVTVLTLFLPQLTAQAVDPRRGSSVFESIMRSSHELSLNFLPAAVQFGAFFSGLTIVYVLLRHREDGVRLEESIDTP